MRYEVLGMRYEVLGVRFFSMQIGLIYSEFRRMFWIED